MLSYRRELDGLRALAVIAVIIYHANLKVLDIKIFQGGFFGVDVFFVLSGYLITGIIRNQMDNDTFSFKHFYWKRAKRIIPAFVTMLLFTSGLACLILIPDDLITYAKSLQSTLYFGSNHFFYGEESYTAAASIYRPLLHTWSLSVEWQFYILFPFIIWTINRFFPQYLFESLFILALLSLQASNSIVKTNPDMAFYLLPTRAWELILGGLATFYNRANIERAEKGSLASLVYKSLSLIGLFLIVHSMLFIGHEVKHPSFITLLPVLGTCLFIMFSHKGELSNDILSLKPVVGIGLISYSLYLWHQPVFVFFRLLKHDYFRYEQLLLLILVTFVISLLSYKMVESPFREKKSIKVKYTLLLTCIIALNLFVIQIEKKSGVIHIFNNTANLFKDLRSSVQFVIDGETKSCHHRDIYDSCKLIGDNTNGNILLLGDSHAGILGLYTFNYTQSNKMSFTDFSVSACGPLDGLPLDNNKVYSEKCLKVRPQIEKYLDDKSSPRFKIIYSTSIASLHEDKLEKFISAYKKLTDWSNMGHDIILVYPSPRYYVNVPHEIQKKLNTHLPFDRDDVYKDTKITIPYQDYLKRAKIAYEALDSVKGENVIRVYPENVFCSNKKTCHANNDQHIYYYDHHHLSQHGSKLLVDEIFRHINDSN